MFTLVVILHMLLCTLLVGLVLVQQGKGADLGATLGGGSNTVFGAGGASNMLVKVTTGTAIIFMFTSIALIRLYQDRVPGMVPTDVLEGSVTGRFSTEAAPIDASQGGAPEVQGEEVAAAAEAEQGAPAAEAGAAAQAEADSTAEALSDALPNGTNSQGSN